MVVEASVDVALAAEYAFVLYIDSGTSFSALGQPLYCSSLTG
jgi:hypothetical protein